MSPAHRRDERGQVIPIVAVALAVMLGMAALVVDVGYAYYVKRTLQSSVDAAALAAAQELPNSVAAVDTARLYSASPGGKNEHRGIRDVVTTATAICVEVSPCRPTNAVRVKSTVQTKTRFAGIFGLNSFEISATATACSPCAARPLDIMLVLDRTGSMCVDHWGRWDDCKDLENAREGLLTFLKFMDEGYDRVGLAVFPPATRLDRECRTPATSNYDSTSAPYVLVQLSEDYGGNGTLDERSRLVRTIRCLQGGGGTAYATALERAQQELDSPRGRPDVQDVIVFFSDGAANYGPSWYPDSSDYRRRPCGQGVASAGTIKNGPRKTMIYSIGYDLDALDGGANKCESVFWNPVTRNRDEQPPITAYQALERIASSSDTFFNKPNAGELNSIYTAIAGELAGVRLIE